jgi:integrase
MATQDDDKIRRAVKRIKDPPKSRLRDCDQELLLTYYDRLAARNRQNASQQKGRQSQLLEQNRLIAVQTELLAETLESGQVGVNAVDSILEHYENENVAGTTLEIKYGALKDFARTMLEVDDKDLPERFADITPWSFRDLNPVPLPSEVVEWSDIVDMCETRSHIRDKAIVATQWSAMTRPEAEMHSMQFCHVDDQGSHIKLTIPEDSKTGYRTAYLFAGAPLLRKWLYHEHPAQNSVNDGPTPDTHIWVKQQENKLLRYNSYAKIFGKLAERADIDKPVTGRHLRRSRASVLASRPTIDEQDLRNLGGWSFGSDKPKHYIANYSQQTARHVAAADGADFDSFDKPSPIAPIECTNNNCGRWTERHFDSCIWCSASLPDSSSERIELSMGSNDCRTEDFLGAISDGEINLRDLEGIKRCERYIRGRKDFFEELPHIISIAEEE